MGICREATNVLVRKIAMVLDTLCEKTTEEPGFTREVSPSDREIIASS